MPCILGYKSPAVLKLLDYCCYKFCNCRFGHDYVGGYEREMGGRLGYGDERPHGRYVGRASGGYGPSGSGNYVAL